MNQNGAIKMTLYVLKINNSTYVTDIHWIAMEIPEIKTGSLVHPLLVTNDYLDESIFRDGTNFLKGKTRRDLIMQYFPHIKIVKVKIVEDEN